MLKNILYGIAIAIVLVVVISRVHDLWNRPTIRYGDRVRVISSFFLGVEGTAVDKRPGGTIVVKFNGHEHQSFYWWQLEKIPLGE